MRPAEKKSLLTIVERFRENVTDLKRRRSAVHEEFRARKDAEEIQQRGKNIDDA